MGWTLKLLRPSARAGRTEWFEVGEGEVEATRRVELSRTGDGRVVCIPVFHAWWTKQPGDRTFKALMRLPAGGFDDEKLRLEITVRDDAIVRIGFQRAMSLWSGAPTPPADEAPLSDGNLLEVELGTGFAQAVLGCYSEDRSQVAGAFSAKLRLTWQQSLVADAAGRHLWYPAFVVDELRAGSSDSDRMEPWLFTTWSSSPAAGERHRLPRQVVQVPAEAVLPGDRYEACLRRPDEGWDYRHGWIVQVRGLANVVGRRVWNRYVESYARGIELAAGEPASFVPSLEAGRHTWAATYLLVDRDDRSGDQERLRKPLYRLDGLRTPDAKARRTAVGRALASFAEADRPVSDVRTLSLMPDAQDEETVRFPLARSHSGAALQCTFEVASLFEEPEADDPTHTDLLENARVGVEARGLLLPLASEARVRRGAPDRLAERRLRMGAVDLLMSPALSRSTEARAEFAKDGGAPSIRLFPVRPSLAEGLHELPPSFELAGVEARLQLAVAAVEPGGQDEPDGRWTGAARELGDDFPPKPEDQEEWIDQRFSRPAPLTLPLPEDDDSSGAHSPVLLEVRETRGDVTVDHLVAPPAPGGPRKPLPWQIRNIELQLRSATSLPPGGGGGGGQTLGDVCGADRAGAIVLDSEPFLVALVRYPRLETRPESAALARWVYDGFGRPAWHLFLGPRDTCLQLPPQGVGEEMERYRNLADKENATFDFRLSPPATLAVRRNEVERNYQEAPWNLRRLLADEWEESPGVVVEQVEYELLYGLFCNTPQERASGLLRLADVVATAGPVPGPMPRAPRWRPATDDAAKNALAAYLQARVRWARTVDQLQARLAVLETWDPRRPAQLQRRLDVECHLRSEAALATVEEPCDGGLLCGGPLYGVEPPPVYRALRQAQRDEELSSEAFVDDLRLSSLGGFGTQTARFLDGLVTFIAEVSMGRLQMLRVEILGRIGCWWNRARYVVVYRRLPGASDQFQPYQTPLEGRMALRKAEEFVEVLEPRRRYPDRSAAVERHTGCVEACEFEEGARFNVLSFWSETVGERGWKIPIWRTDAQERPETAHLYPQPQVSVSLYSNVDGESRPAPCTLANPENVYFYTEVPDDEDAEKGEMVDPDAWPAVVGVDLVDEPRPAARPDFRGGNKVPATPPDVAEPVGHGPCTFHLEPAPYATDLAAYRGAQPLAAHLSTLTMSRARLATAGGDAAKRIGDAVDGLRQVAARVESFPDDADRGLEELRNDLRSRLGGLCEQMNAVSPRSVEDSVAPLLDEAAWRRSCEAKLEETLHRWLDGSAATTREQVHQLASATRSATADVLTRLRGRAAPVARGFLATGRFAVDAGSRVSAALERQAKRAREIRDRAEAELAAVPEGDLRSASREAIRRQTRQQLASLVAAARQELEGLADRLRRGPGLQLKLAEDRVLDRLSGALDPYVEEVTRQVPKIGLPDGALTDAAKLVAEIDRWVIAPLEAVRLALNQRVVEPARRLFASLEAQVVALETALDELPQTLAAEVEKLAAPVDPQQLDATIRGLSRQAGEALEPHLAQVAAEARSRLAATLQPLADVQQRATAACEAVGTAVDGTLAELREALGRHLGDLAQAVRLEITRPLEPVFAEADGALRLVRAFGEPPRVEGLGFDRPEIAYFFDELAAEIDVTPVLAGAAQVSALAGGLKPLGIDLPTVRLSDRLLPPELRDFDVASILPDVAGVDLSGLFPGFKVPGGSQVDVQHGLDPETRRAWLQAELHAASDQRAPLFSTGALSIVLSEPVLTGTVRMEGQAGGTLRRRVDGTMNGTWEIVIGGRSLVRFPKTTLYFDGDGHVRFDLRPERIEMDQTLAFVQKLLESLVPGDGSCFRIEPTGVVAELSLPLPNLQGGTFGITNLVLGAHIALRYAPFAIEAGFHLARPQAPFTLSVFILGGAGYLTTSSSYLPATGEVKARLDMAIAASASLALSLGPIEGGVYVYFGVHAHYENRGSLDVGLFILIRGHVSVLGIASATLCLRLAVSYGGGSGVIATGTVSLRIRICWCFTLKVHKEVTYRMGAASRDVAARSALPGANVRLAQAGLPPVRARICPPLKDEYKNIFHQRVEEYLGMVA